MESLLKTYSSQLAKWQKIVGVFFAVSVVLMVLFGLVCIIFAGQLGSDFEESVGGAIGIRAMGVLYFLLGLLYFFPTKYLLNSAKKIKEWVVSDDERDLTEGVMNTKSFFKFTGVLCIIGLSILAVAIIAVAVAAIAAAV